MLPGIASSATANNMWTFAFQDAATLYVADTTAVSYENVRIYTLAGGYWSQTGTILFEAGSPVYSIAGAAQADGSFALFGVTKTALYKYANGTVSRIASPPAGAVFRGVVAVPNNPVWIAPSHTMTPSHTPSPSNTGSVTASPSSSHTASISATATRTPPATKSPSRSGTPTTTRSSSKSPSVSGTAAATSSPAASPTASKTSSASGSASGSTRPAPFPRRGR